MKTIKMLVAVIGMMAMLATSNLFADGGPTTPSDCNLSSVPDRLPLSMSDMQAQAWEKVANVGMWSWASSAIQGSTNVKSSVWVSYQRTNGVARIKDIFSLIKAQRLTLSVLYPSDEIELQTGLYDINGENLSYGYSRAPINTPNQGVSSNRLGIILQMNDQFLVPFNGATSFTIVERDGNGNPIRFYYSRDYDVQNGMIRIPGYFLDKNGEVIVTLCNDLEVAYSLNNKGQRITPSTVQIEVASVSAIGSREFSETNVVYVEVSREEVWQNINPLSQLVNSTNGLVYFAAWLSGPNLGQISEYASQVYYWPQGQSSSVAQKVQISSTDHRGSIYLASGNYWIKFAFPSGWPGRKNQFSPPYEYNGGGGGYTTLVTEQ